MEYQNRFDKIEEKIDKLHEKLDTYNTRLVKAESTLGFIKTGLAALMSIVAAFIMDIFKFFKF